MMSRIYIVFALLVSMTLLVSYSDNPPQGRTGAPGDGLCSDCHSLNGGMQDGTLTLAGFPAVITPNATYLLTITNSNPNGIAELGGFQMTLLDANDDFAGNLTADPGDPNSTVSMSGGREYWEHDPAQDYPGNNMVSFTVSWQAPAGPANTVITYYAAGNVANGNNNDSGDLIITTTGTGTLDGGVEPLQADIFDSSDVLCFGGNTGTASAGAIGGTEPYEFLWSNGSPTSMVTNLNAGMHTVTVTDADDNTSSASVVISQPANIVFQSATITGVSCFGGADGSILANATGGIPPYAYEWSNGFSGNPNTGLAIGSYTVTVYDDNNCTKTATYSVTQPSEIDITLVTLNDESCSGSEDGSISIAVTGGTSPIFAEWSNGFIGTTISDLAPDTYTVTVTDNNDCTMMASYSVEPGGIIDVILQQIQHTSCNGGEDGAITVLASGGQSPYSYAWSNGDNGPSITNLAAGNYLVTATDDNGCSIVELYTVNQPLPIIIQINTAGQNLCFGDSLVDLTAIATSQNPPFTGVWSNGVTGLTNNDLSAGSYTITVTDGSGCTASTSATVVSPTQITVTVQTTDETAQDADDGTAKAIVAGGTPSYTYLWSNGATTDSIGGLAPGVYTVTITDTNGCVEIGTGQVDEFGCTLNIDLGPDFSICEGDTAVLSAPGFTNYSWSTGASTSEILVTAGEYCLTVTDDQGCNDVDCIIITENIFPLITCPVVNETLPGANDGSISCDSISGSISYQWSNGATTPSITNLAPDLYCVTMTNDAGCTAEQCFTVQAGNCALVITSIFSNVLCAGDSTGSVSVNVENATPPVNYIWSNGDTTATITNLPIGDFLVTITDAAGCGEIFSFPIVEPAPLVITVDTVIIIGIGDDGQIQVSVSGGVDPYEYQWNFPDGSVRMQEDLFDLQLPGLYNLEVNDGNGCEASVNVVLELEVSVDRGPDFKPLRVYPVPAVDVLQIDLDQPITEAMIMGIDGRMHQRILNPASNILQVGALEPGWYIIRMTDGLSWYVARMVK